MSAFLQGLRILASTKPKWALSKEDAAIWQIVLGTDLPDDAILRAALQLARESEYEPTPAAWRSRALAIVNGIKMTPSEAWDEMYRNRHARHFKEPKWSHESIRRAAESVQWDDPNWENEQLPTIRAQFERYFKSLVEKEVAIDAAVSAEFALPQVSSLMLKMDAKKQLGDGK